MDQREKCIVIVENLSLWNVLPLYFRLKRLKLSRLFYIDATPPAIKLLNRLLQNKSAAGEVLRFRLIDAKSERGNSVYLEAIYEELVQIQAAIANDPMLKPVFDYCRDDARAISFLKKEALLSTGVAKDLVLRALYLLRIVDLYLQKEGLSAHRKIFYARPRRWNKVVSQYASRKGIEYIELFDVELNFKQHIKEWFKVCWLTFVGKRRSGHVKALQNPPAKVLVNYYGHFHLDDPAMYSDVFFYQQSTLPAKNILLGFNIPSDPLTDERAAIIKRHGMSAVVFNFLAAKSKDADTFYYYPRPPKPRALPRARSADGRWLNHKYRDYLGQLDYWKACFKRFNVKVHTTWYKYNAQQIVQAAALKETGGIASVYQRAFEEFVSPVTAVDTDIIFGFSSLMAQTCKDNNARFLYYVITGWLGDHRFELLKPRAQEIRHKLQQAGAQKILAYFDEGSASDDRWQSGHSFMRENYAFLLQKVLAHPWLGLVIKPKVPKTLRQRLGPLLKELEKAEATGRCLVLSGGEIVGSTPPAMAALASDITIHGHFAAATAGIEAILAGCRTVMYDGEGWHKSCLRDALDGKCIFDDWSRLWEACQQYWQAPESQLQLGNWSDYLEYFDPFRDGKAARRMGEFLHELMKGFEQGLSREAVMERAVELYRRQWGQDKVIAYDESGALAGARQ